jgi:hypothetical protein
VDWLGYGVGFESSAVSAPKLSATGPEFAHLMGGVDFRISKVFGIGPFVDLSVAQYSSFNDVDDGSRRTPNNDIKDKAIHEWLTMGAKLIFFP